MSCYMCTVEHISFLAHYAVTKRLYGGGDRSDSEAMADLYTLLALQNAVSVASKYSEALEANRGAFEMPPVAHREAIAVIKSANGYRYQACEGDSWNDSGADNITQLIINRAIRDLPGYAAASWGAP